MARVSFSQNNSNSLPMNYMALESSMLWSDRLIMQITLNRVSQFSNSTIKLLTEEIVAESYLTDLLILLIDNPVRKNMVQMLQ